MGSYEPVSPTDGGNDLQENRGPGPVRIVVWIAAGLILLLATALTVTAIALPGCASCHDSREFVTQTNSRGHSQIACIRCHVEPNVPARVTYAYNELFGMTLGIGRGQGGPTTAIQDSTCLSCHKDVMAQKVTLNGLSILHSQCTKGRVCTDCHSDTAHGAAVKWVRTSNMNQCLECHKTDTCVTCHAEKEEEERLNSGEWAITHGAGWRQTHGMGDLDTCVACHAPSYCQRCHGIPMPHNASFFRAHPAWAQTNKKDCAGCHKQAFCDSCHGIKMPHPAGFTPLHSAVVRKQGTEVCNRCHLAEDCDTCHNRHVHPGGATSPPISNVRASGAR